MEWLQKFDFTQRQRSSLTDPRGKSFGDELGAILDTFVDLVEWLEERYGSAKEAAKEQVEKFKQKINEFKKLNGGMVPDRQPTELQRGDTEFH
ncbi:MAG: hypothetical protein KA247_01820 [Bacteroidetes bacterium]|nr:hypothetical protein [Bacteroidota bacterium]